LGPGSLIGGSADASGAAVSGAALVRELKLRTDEAAASRPHGTMKKMGRLKKLANGMERV
jgi:hypothetical protein